MPSLSAVLQHTPIWVWALLAYIVFVGWKRSRPRTARPIELLGFGGLFVLLVLVRLWLSGFAPVALAGTVVGWSVGSLIVLWLRPARHTLALPDGRLQIAGEWVSLALLLVLFVGNYGHAVLSATDPAFDAALLPAFAFSTLNASIGGFMLTRTLAHLRAGRAARPLGGLTAGGASKVG